MIEEVTYYDIFRDRDLKMNFAEYFGNMKDAVIKALNQLEEIKNDNV